MTKITDTERVESLPVWTGAVSITPLEGGLSNKSYVVQDAKQKCVVRLGDDIDVHHVSRDNELMVSRAAHSAGFSPAVIHSAPGIMVLRFIEGTTYGETEVRDNRVRLIELLKSFHSLMPRHVSGSARLFWVFHVIRDYARTLRNAKSRMTGKLAEFVSLAEAFETVQPSLPIVFGHGDLLPANFIDDGEKIWIIDFEYAAYSTAMFDLAGLASNAQFSAEQDEALLASYFDGVPGEALLRGHAAMKCASLLREAMWSMVSEHHLNAPGVDYVAYTQENLDRFDSALAGYQSRFGRIE